MGQVVGVDHTAAIKTAEILGYDVVAVLELLPAGEVGFVNALTEQIKEN